MTAITWVVDAAYAADLAGALRAQGFPVVGIAEPAPATTNPRRLGTLQQNTPPPANTDSSLDTNPRGPLDHE